MADQDDTFHDDVLRMADRLGLKGNERRKYVHDHMTGAGYRMEPTYVKTDDDDDDDDDRFFSRKRSKSSSRHDGDDDGDRRSRRSKPRGGADDWYS